jgi:hypothetical protein
MKGGQQVAEMGVLLVEKLVELTVAKKVEWTDGKSASRSAVSSDGQMVEKLGGC